MWKSSFSYAKSFNIPVSIALATLAHMIDVYEICFNTTNYLIFNMQDFRYCLWSSNLDYFGQLVSPAWTLLIMNINVLLAIPCGYYFLTVLINAIVLSFNFTLSGGIENEYHFIHKCATYNNICRVICIMRNVSTRNNICMISLP